MPGSPTLRAAPLPPLPEERSALPSSASASDSDEREQDRAAQDGGGPSSSRRGADEPSHTHACESRRQEPESPRRRELLGHIAANFPAVAFHAFGRLPNGVSDPEIRRLSLEIEDAAHRSTQHIQDANTRRQQYYQAASRKLLEVVLEHCPPDADLTACQPLPAPERLLLEPLSQLRPHVARPPMDPRFNATSPFAEHTGQPLSPGHERAPFGQAGGAAAGLQAFGSPLAPSTSYPAAGVSLSAASARSASLIFAHSASLADGGLSPGQDLRAFCRNRSVQRSLSLRQASRPQLLSLASLGRSSGVWGWLEPTDAGLPPVLLEGPGLAIGRSREGFEARRHALSLAASEAGAIPDASPLRRLAEVQARALGFLEVADGRVSRLHCMVQANTIQGLPFQGLRHAAACVEDHSTNGTFVNGSRLPRRERRPLADGDCLAIVLSPSPMLERSFVLHLGDPGQDPRTRALDWADTAPSALCAAALGEDEPEAAEQPGAARSPRHLKRMHSSRKGLRRMATSHYTTADSSEPGDLMCQICLGPLRACLALRPCGHSFCAACLSHHFASLLQAGQALSCPLRCPAPQQVVVNATMRRLVKLHFPPAEQRGSTDSQPGSPPPAPRADLPEIERLPWQSWDKRGNGAAAAAAAASEVHAQEGEEDSDSDTDADEEAAGAGSDGEGGDDCGALTDMAALCPLWDDMLPLDVTSLKTKQVELALRDLQHSDVQRVLAALEVLARLAWSDDEVRTVIAMRGGIQAVVGLMRTMASEPSLLCNACLCLMSLVRGEGPACEANQWQVAKAGGVEATVGCMTAFAQDAVVQLSALLCLIPLALDNASLQAHVATLALPAVVVALRAHEEHADVQAKGLVVLGVLGQGEEAVHDAIRQQQLAVGATGRILAALRRWGAANEEVLWAVLFSLAVLVRDGAQPFQPAIRAAAAAGIPPLLTAVLEAYKAGGGLDEMIVTAGDYLLRTLAPAAAQLTRERYGIAGLAMAPVVAASAFWAWRSAGR